MTAPHPPTARSGNDLRILRAAVFAAVCVVLAAAGHTLASCATVPLWSLGAGFLGAVLVAVPLAGRLRSLAGIAMLLAVGQTALHTLFGLGQHGTTMAAAPAPASGGGAGALSDASLVQQAARLVCGTTAAAISPAQAQRILTDARIPSDASTGAAHHPADALSSAGASASLLPSLPMLLGHVLAALAAGWLLRRGDLALARLVELSAHSAHSVAEAAFVRALRAALSLVRALHAGLAGAPGTGPRPPRPALWVAPRPRTTALQHTVVRRGPPTDAFALAA
ncbi:Integral membrane protein OS=Streptomyces tendae OX=1932 GN=GUR47_21405 PE=4 SV=1 [Streptomyces tendae]